MDARTFLVSAALGLAAVTACSDDTGILIEVRGDQLDQAVIRLETMVILDATGVPPDSAAWGGAEREQVTVESDLRESPYTVMLRPDGVDDGAMVWAAAIAYDGNGTVIGFGELAAPVAFTQDLVKKVALDLVPARRVSDGCIAKDGKVVVRVDDDCDDDSFDYTVDCDDLDALIGGDVDGDPVVCDPDCDQTSGEIYPGNAETCDGFDSDCDPATAPPPRLCAEVVREGEQVVACAVGQRSCPDTAGVGVYGPCMASPVDAEANAELCDAWADCLATADPDLCLVDHRAICKLGVADAPGGPCVPADVELREFFEADVCTWRLVGTTAQTTWNLGVRPRGAATVPTSFTDACDAELVVTEADLVPRVIVLEVATLDAVQLISVLIEPKRTGCDPNQPSDLECSLAP